MRKTLFFTIFCLLITATAYAGQIQISTYYPSPFGYYERLKFNPRIALGEPCEVGTIYYLSGAGLKYCAEDTTWKNVGGGAWTQNADDIYPIDTAVNPNLKVGIGTDAPNNRIQVQDLINFDDANQMTALGYQTGNANTNGMSGTFVGYRAGLSNTIGNGNTFVGNEAGIVNISGVSNTFLGNLAGSSNTTANFNTFLGAHAGAANTSGYSNTFVGISSGTANTGGYENTFLGDKSGSTTTTGNSNILIGFNANAPQQTTSNFLNIGNTIYGDLITSKIGIGTTSPSESLHIQSTSPSVRLERTDNANRNMVFFYPAGAVSVGNEIWGMGIPAAADYFTIGYDTDLAPPGTQVLQITNTGNVGIGTPSPTSRLHVYATEGYSPPGVFLDDADIAVNGGPDGQFMIRNNSGSGTQKIFLTGTSGATPVLTVDGVAENVGIGTMTPATKLEVAGGAIKATGGFILETRTTNPGSPVAGQMWVCTDTGDATPCNGI